MKFGPVPVGDAAGAIAAHSVRIESGTIKKGHRLTETDIRRLEDDGVATIVVARLEPGDVAEDDVAQAIAAAAAGGNLRIEPPFTGRANLYAEQAGVLIVDKAAIDALNRTDPAITLATLPQFSAVAVGQMVATVKIIPYAVPGAALDRALAALAAPAVSVAPFRPLKIGLLQTRASGTKESVLDKTARVLADRLGLAGATVVAERRIGHDIAAVADAMGGLAAAGAELLIAFGASAVADRRDVIPAAIEAAGGIVDHFGMPVDPGNLLLVGRIGPLRVIGAPGCARSPKENGFDWVLMRM
ncbi:MAG: molybdopterin-binding protein, partial [Hyphomicrobiales bacterium]|nr:molybdopterin-binding protein [Hyphomicrobiales bacterium]